MSKSEFNGYAGFNAPVARLRVIYSFHHLEQIVETCHLEHLLDAFVDATDEDLMAFALDILENIQEDAQSTGGDILQFAAVEDDVMIFAFEERQCGLVSLGGCSGVEPSVEVHYIVVVLFFKCRIHFLFILLRYARFYILCDCVAV